MSASKRNNQMEFEENLSDQEQYNSSEQQKYYDDIFEDPEKAVQANCIKSTNSNQSTNKKEKKSVKEGEETYFI